MWAQSAAEIGQIIAAARRHHKMSQAELARALGTTQGWISEVEQGKDTAQIGKVLRVLSELGVRLRAGVVPWDKQSLADASAVQPRDEPVSLARIISQLSLPVREDRQLPERDKRPGKGGRSGGSHGARRSIHRRAKK